MAFLFEQLTVYQKALDFADQTFTLTEKFGRGYGFLAAQFNRAALSIATNLAEGNGRFNKRDRINFFLIARGSAQECVPILELARRRKLIDGRIHVMMREELEIIGKMLNGLIKENENRK